MSAGILLGLTKRWGLWGVILLDMSSGFVVAILLDTIREWVCNGNSVNGFLL